MNSQPSFLSLTYLNLMNYGHIIKSMYQKHVYKPDNFESHNPLKLSFTNIWELLLDFNDCESFLESNPPDSL